MSIGAQIINTDLKIFEELFDFGKLNRDHDLFSNKNKKVVGKFKLETLKSFCVGEFVALRSKAFSFKCNDEKTSELKSISKFCSNYKIIAE